MRRRRTRADGPRRVLVTGAGRGIGRAVAAALARDGFAVTLHFRTSKAAAEALAAELAGCAGGPPRLLGFDVADRDAARGALEADLAAHGPYYAAALCAGVHEDAPFPGLSEGAWDRVLRTNLDGFYHVLHPLVLPMVQARAGGRIVAISSVSALRGNRGQVNYAASKAGLIGATRALALELATREITVNCVAPGWIGTDMLEGADREALAALVPMKRIGTPEDVAGAVSYLFSDAAGYVTGQVLAVAGGLA